MNPSFGDNKRKPGGTASQLTQARRLAAIAQTWTQPSKQPRVPSAGGVPAVFARLAGSLALQYAATNGAIILPPPSTALGQFLRSRNRVSDDGFELTGDSVDKDMEDNDYTERFDPMNYYPQFFPAMSEFTDGNIVEGDKAPGDKNRASHWRDLDGDVFDTWGFFYLYDVESGKYYFPLISPQNESDGVLTTQTFNAFGRSFTIVHGWAVHGVFKFDISVTDSKPFRFGAYGNMGWGDDQTSASELTRSFTLGSKTLTMYYREDSDDSGGRILYSYVIPKTVSETASRAYQVTYDGDDMSLVSSAVTHGLLVYFAKSNDVKDWVVNDIEMITNGTIIDLPAPPAPPGSLTVFLRSKNRVLPADGSTIGNTVEKDMGNSGYTNEFDPMDYYPQFFPGMAEFTDGNIVEGDKNPGDKNLASYWDDLGNDVFDGWGFFYLYDVESGKYYFPLLSPQNESDGVLTTQPFNAFGRIFLITHGWVDQGIFKFDITDFGSQKPFRFGAYGDMGSDGDQATANLTHSYTLPGGLTRTLYYREDRESDSVDERLYTYFVPKATPLVTSRPYRVIYNGENMSMVSAEVTRGLIVYFAKSNDVKDWVVNDLELA